MSKTKRSFLFFICCLILLSSSCHLREKPDGGPCSYTTTIYPATIINIFKVDSGMNQIFFIIKTLEPADTISWSNEFSSYLSDDELKSENYKLGDTLAYEIREIIDGNCSPYLKRLTMARYKK